MKPFDLTVDRFHLPDLINMDDKMFAVIPGACYVHGYAGQRYMDQFSGVGISPAEYRMKAIIRDGVYYIFDLETSSADWRTNGARFKRAPVQSIPADKVKMCIRIIES